MATQHTTIEWTDRTWNPVTGCTKVSPGCDHCYAETIAHRFAGSKAFPNGFDVTQHEARLSQPLRWRRPARVFVNSMSDLFHADVPGEFIARVFAVMALTPQHTFQVLTKRHARMRALLSNREFVALVDEHREQLRPGCGDFAWPLPNVWLGVSVENQKWADIRIPALLETPAAVRFLSCEPLLGPVDLKQAVRTMGSERGHGLTASFIHVGDCCRKFHGIDWVIVGGESGPGARAMDLSWASQIVEQCQHSGVAAFVKQLGSRWGKAHKDIDQFPAALRMRDFPQEAANA